MYVKRQLHKLFIINIAARIFVKQRLHSYRISNPDWSVIPPYRYGPWINPNLEQNLEDYDRGKEGKEGKDSVLRSIGGGK